MKVFKTTLAAALIASAATSLAATDQKSRNTIWVNSEVTTHIIMPENLKMVDISTPKIIGNQCTDNMVRIKPAPSDSIGETLYHNEFLGTVTLIGERHIAQYDIRYNRNPELAASMFSVSYDDTRNYTNPGISMPEAEMANLAWAIYGSKRKFNNIRTSRHGIKASIYNIYSIGNYFFIDFGLENKTNIPYNIEEIRVSLNDKKEVKATNSQSLQISPVYMLNQASGFKKNYRQVLVLEKLTFPEEKVVNITVSENQISGRNITLAVEYDDVLNADGFDISKTRPAEKIVYVRENQENQKGKRRSGSSQNTESNSKIKHLEKQKNILSDELSKARSEISGLRESNRKLKLSLDKMEAAYNGANETIKSILSKEN